MPIIESFIARIDQISSVCFFGRHENRVFMQNRSFENFCFTHFIALQAFACRSGTLNING